MTTASAHARNSPIKKRSAGYLPLMTEPAEGFDPRVTTPSTDETKFEYTTGVEKPSRP